MVGMVLQWEILGELTLCPDAHRRGTSLMKPRKEKGIPYSQEISTTVFGGNAFTELGAYGTMCWVRR
jgi:hypothetical protein